MTFTSAVFILIALLGSVLFLAIPKSRFKAWVSLFYILFSVCLFAGAFEIIGEAKPVDVEWRHMGGYRVLSLYWDEDNRKVYVWILRDGVPKAYVYPWPKDAKDVEKAQEEWRKKGDGELYTSDDDKSALVERPTKPLPEKT